MRQTPSGCLCSSTLWLGVERRVEPEPALGREVGLHLHVGDQEAVAEDAALALLAEQRAQRRARAVAGGDVVGFAAGSGRRACRCRAHAVGALLDADDLVLPAQVDVRQLGRALGQVGLDVVLLQVDEGRPLVAGLGQQVEAVEQLVARRTPCRRSTTRPWRTMRVAAAQAVEDLERALGEADRARAGGQRVVVVEQQHRLAALREVDRQAQAHRAGADDDDRVAHRRRGVLVGASGGSRTRASG